MPSSPTHRRRKRWLHLPHDHGEPIWHCRYDFLATATFLFAAVLVWADWPIKTHALIVDLYEPAFWEASQFELQPGGEVTHVVSITEEGTLTWNGVAVLPNELREQVDLGMMQRVEPRIVFAPQENASYDASLRAIAIIRMAGVTKFCFGDLDLHRNFGTGETASRLSVTYAFPSTEPIAPLPERPLCSG